MTYYLRVNDATDCAGVCGGSGSQNFVYSPCNTLDIGCYIYANPGLTVPYENYFLTDGVTCYETDSSGQVINVSTCPSPTPTNTTTPANTPTPTETPTNTPTPSPVASYFFCMGYDSTDCLTACSDYVNCNL